MIVPFSMKPWVTLWTSHRFRQQHGAKDVPGRATPIPTAPNGQTGGSMGMSITNRKRCVDRLISRQLAQGSDPNKNRCLGSVNISETVGPRGNNRQQLTVSDMCGWLCNKAHEDVMGCDETICFVCKKFACLWLF